MKLFELAGSRWEAGNSGPASSTEPARVNRRGAYNPLKTTATQLRKLTGRLAHPSSGREMLVNWVARAVRSQDEACCSFLTFALGRPSEL